MGEGIGERFQQQTKYFPFKMERWLMGTGTNPDRYKMYPASTHIKLPIPRVEREMFLDYAFKKRQSVRLFTCAPLKLQHLSYLLWASTGIQRIENGQEFRTAPSAGALYPIETYIVANNIERVEKAVYHYGIKAHVLEEIREGDHSAQMVTAAMGQQVCSQAAAVFIWTAVFERCRAKYGQRAYRYIYLDAGHMAENLALAAVSLGLGSCPVAALYDDEVNSIIDVDGEEESVIYIMAAGWPRA